MIRWDIRTAKPLVSFKYKTLPIRNVAFSPNGRLLSSYFHLNKSSTIVVWDIALQKMLGSVQLPAEVGHATSMTFSYGSHTLLIACSYGALVHIFVDHLLRSSAPSTCVENFLNGESNTLF
jgi:WD40 repeat protein